MTAHWKENKETGGWEFGLPAIVGVNGGSRLRGDQEICHKDAEHGCAVYFDATNSGPL